MAARTRAPRPRKQWIARAAALEAVDNALDFGLVLIVAPPGYGKTALAAQFCAAHPERCAWLTLSDEEQAPTALVRSLVAAVVEARPGLVPPADVSTDDGLAQLLSRPGVAPLAIFLDDFQRLDASQPAMELIYGLARAMPEGVTLVGLSRFLPQLSPGALIAHQQAVVLGTSILRLRETDVRHIMARARGIPPEAVPEHEALRALTDSDGWPLGLGLSEQARAMSGEAGDEQTERFAAVLDEYLEGGVFGEVPQPVLDFLTRASTFETFTEAQCAQAGMPGSASLLREAQRQNLFIQTVAGGAEKTYRIQPQVRAYLRRRFARQYPGELRPTAPAVAVATTAPREGEPGRVWFEARGFGVGRVWRNGELLTAAHFGYNIPRELLFFMLTSKTSTRERIGGVFWPDASTSAMQRGFHNAKFAIRTALKEQAILYSDGVYSMNNELDLTYDVWDFEKNVNNAVRAGSGEALQMLLAAAELYTDDFLVDSQLDWALETRRRLKAKFTRCCIDAASIALRRNQPEAVSELLMRGYYLDRTREELARALIVTQSMMGNRSAALDTYSDLANVLRREFSIDPQPETEELARRVRAGAPVTDLLPSARRASG